MSDHLEDIHAAAEARTEDARGWLRGTDAAMEALNADILEVQTFRDADREEYRVEITLTIGGPTVFVVVDSRWSDTAEFHHSWGRGSDGQPCDEIDLYGRDAAPWREVAEMLAGE